MELDDCLLIINDRKGRKFAYELGLTIIGTVGIIVDAKLTGIFHQLDQFLQKSGQQTLDLQNDWSF